LERLVVLFVVSALYIRGMNKGRRNELKQLHYKRRRRIWRIPPNQSAHFLKTTGKPCSCWACQPPDENYNRAKEKRTNFELLQDFE
jgi:hypothetical protein